MLNGLFGITIKGGPRTTDISGVNYRSFNDDIIIQYGTTTPGKYMFRRVNYNKFTTDNFFLLELEFLISQLLQSKNIRSRRRDIYDLQTKLRSETWIKDTLDPRIEQINIADLKNKFKLVPYPSQLDFLSTYKGIKEGYHLKGQLLDAKPGSGKTPISLWWGYLNGNAKHIIICPNATVESVWLKHIKEKMFVNAPKVWSTREGTVIDPTADYFIFHNEFVRSDAYMKAVGDVFKAANGKGVDLVVDECHNFNDLSSKQTQNLIESCDHFKFNDTLPMSGTPLKGMAKEAYTVFALIDNFFTGSARERFNKSYGLSRDKLNTLLARRIGRLKYTIEALVGMQHEEPEIEVRKVKFKGSEQYTLRAVRLQMLDYIKDRIKFYEERMPEFIDFFNSVLTEYESNIRDDKVALARLTEYRRIVMKFRTQGYSSFTDNADSKFAKSVEVDIEEGLKGERLKTFRNIKSAVKYVGLKIRGEALGLVLGKARMHAVRDTLANADIPGIINDATKKTLIFTSYVDVLEECESQLLDLGFKPVTIYGENNNLRDQSVAKFASDPSVNPAITTFDSLREGVDMTAASTEIFLNSPWRDYEMKQAKARIYRQGQDTAVRYVLIDLDTGNEPNITTRSIDIMEWSREQTDILLGRSTLSNPGLRAIVGAEDYGIIDEPETFMIPKANSSVLSLFI